MAYTKINNRADVHTRLEAAWNILYCQDTAISAPVSYTNTGNEASGIPHECYRPISATSHRHLLHLDTQRDNQQNT